MTTQAPSFPIILTNATLADIDPPNVQPGWLRIIEGQITDRGETAPLPGRGETVVDCGGAVVLPGLANGHTHLYSALAVGMPPPPRTPQNFREILEFIWWRLDRALDETSIRASAQVGAIQALCCGTTTLIDHHASPAAIEGSLDLVQHGLRSVGLRGVLCYETTDRHGRDGAERGLAENERFLHRCASPQSGESGMFAGLVGAHASFTLSDSTLAHVAAISARHQAGVHIHVAEDPCDEQACRHQYGKALVDRLGDFGLLNPRTIFAHGTHLDVRSVQSVNRSGLHLAHNPRSNMNNAVGYAPITQFQCPVMLGTDGIGGDMFAESKSAWLKSRDASTGFAPDRIIWMLASASRRASASLGVTLGKLHPGAAADVVITDYVPATPLTTENLCGHILFGVAASNVRHVLIGGRFALKDRRVMLCDGPAIFRDARRIASDLWNRMHLLKP